METLSIDVLETIYFFGKIKYKERFLWWHSISQKKLQRCKKQWCCCKQNIKGELFCHDIEKCLMQYKHKQDL